MGHELADILRCDAATIENANGGGCFCAVHISVEPANKLDNFPRALGSGCFAGTNGPDGFVGDHDLFYMLLRETAEAMLDLIVDDFFCFTGVVLIFALTDA